MVIKYVVRPTVVAGAVFVAAFSLAGCGQPSEADQLRDIRASVAQNDTKTAVLQLKTLLQANAESGEARLLLGTLLLRGGNAPGALIELQRASQARQPDRLVFPLMAEALLASRQPKKVVELYSDARLDDARELAALKVMVAMAHTMLGDRASSQAVVKEALALDPKHAAARLMQARLVGESGAIDEALALTAAVIVDEPRQVEALHLRADLLWRGKRDGEAAAKAFADILAVDPSHVAARVGVLTLLLQKPDLAGFKTELAALKKIAPNHPDTRYFDVYLAMVEGDLRRARDGVQQLLRIAPENALAQQLAGGIELRAGALQQAESHLNKALKLSPQLPTATALLAETYLRAGNTERALAMLQPVVDQPTAGAGALALAAQAHLQAGNFAKAELYFGRAAKANPADARAQVALALTQLGKGNAEAGFQQLESLADSDKTTYADLALISARLQRNDTAAALKAVDRLEAKDPGKPLSHLIRARIALVRKDVAGARASFEQALKVDPLYFPAVEDLASLDILQKRPDDARKRYETLLVRQPNNARAMLAVAKLRKHSGDAPEQIEALLVDAVKHNRTDPATHAALVQHRLEQQRAKAAVEAARDALTVLPNDVQMQDLLGQAQQAAGDVQQAILTFGKIAQAQPTVTWPLLRLASAHLARGENAAAAQVLRRALTITPDLVPAQQGLVQAALASKNTEEALRVVRLVQKQRPAEPTGYLMEGELHLNQRNWAAAGSAFRSALERGRSTAIAVRVHAIHQRAGQAAEANRFAESWLSSHPKDAQFLFHLASTAMEQKDFAGAEARYRQVMALQPDNPMTLNNLAWLLMQQRKPGALPLAERANQLAPNQSGVLDTLAAALAEEKQFPQALEWQRKAVALAPDRPGYRLRLARILIDSGDRPNARAELEKLAGMGDQFAAQAEVAKLLKGL